MKELNRQLTKSETNIAQGSIQDMTLSRNERPEDVLAEAEVIVMIDVSGSMGGKKFDDAVAALRQIQASFPGKVVLVEFSTTASFRFNGVPSKPSGGTNMGFALDLALKFKDTGMKFYFISDGEPSDGELAIHKAVELAEPINTIFIGSDYDRAGQQFLLRLADVSKGLSGGTVDASILGDKVVKMLTSGDESI